MNSERGIRMARKKNDSRDAEMNPAEQEQNNAAPPADNTAIEDKLRNAGGNITRAEDNSKARDNELAKKRKEDAKEARAKLAEQEKQKRAAEKEARKAAEAKLAEFEYAESLRKKMQKEKAKADAENKLREKEAKEAERRAAEEASAKRIAEILENERNDAQRRSERADALLKRVNSRDAESAPDAEAPQNVAEDLQNEQNKLDEAVAKAVDHAEEVGETPEEPTEAPKEETELEPDNTEDVSDGSGESEPENEEDSDKEDEAESIGDSVTVTFGDEPVEEPEIKIVYSESEKDEDGTEENDDNEDGDAKEDESDDESDGDVLSDVARWFARAKADGEKKKSEDDGESSDADGEPSDGEDDDDVDPLDEIPSSNSQNSGKRGNAPANPEEKIHEKYKLPLRKKRKERKEPPITDELLEQSDIVEDIRREGRALKINKLSFKRYADNSQTAIRDFMKALKEGKRALDANKDESQAPEIIVNLMKIVAKIIEIRCDNLENFTRLRAHDYINDTRTALRADITEYNDLAGSYASLTGEQLTRISTFLPDNIASGRALAVIPKLTYKESYVQVYLDENGNIPNNEGSLLTPVIPAITAETLMGGAEPPKSAFGFGGYIRNVKSSIKVLEEESDRIGRTISGIVAEEQKYKSELRSLEERTPADKRNSDEYRRAVLDIRFKYGKRLTNVKTAKVKYAFAKTKVRLLVACFAVERERLAVAYRLLRDACKIGKPSHKARAEAIFAEAVSSYNKYAVRCEKNTGVKMDRLPGTIVERACRSKKEHAFPIVAYKRELVETVANEKRAISMTLREALEPNENAYLESSSRILNGTNGFRDRVTLVDEDPKVDRASSVEKVMLDALREYADSVAVAEEFDLYVKKSNRAIKYFNKALKRTETGISKAFDENGVVVALVENLRVISNLIEVRRINISVATRLKRGDFARSEGRALYKDIELYNGRAIDYMSMVGEQFTRITSAPINVLAESADKLRIPRIAYKDNYIEVFPKDPLADPLYEKPLQRRGGYYTPLLMKHFRLTENKANETTVVNAPFVFDMMMDDEQVESWWNYHGTIWFPFFYVFQPFRAFFERVKTRSAIRFIKSGLENKEIRLDNQRARGDRRRRRLEAKLTRLNSKRNEKILALETAVHASDRDTVEYQRQLKKINAEFGRKIYKIKMRWKSDCPTQTEVRRMMEKLVLEREMLIGVNKLLIRFRNFGRITFGKNVLVEYRKLFLEAIQAHNETARKLSKMVGVEFAEVSTNVAEEIIRYGNMVRFPQIICCREIIETVGDMTRSVGDRWHGYGLYTQNPGGTPSGAPPAMSVGAMGYSTEMGIPYFNADFSSMSIIGMTPKGVPLIGFNNGGEVAIPFTGIPMMMRGEDSTPVLDAGADGMNGPMIGAVNAANPHTGINAGAVDSDYVKNANDKAKDGIVTESPLDLETAMIEERYLRALNARALTTVDGVGTWWKLVGSEINIAIYRGLFLNFWGFMRILLPRPYIFRADIDTLGDADERRTLAFIAKLGSIINIETVRLYSATKAGIRRSQRKFSGWLRRDILRYNRLVEFYNGLQVNGGTDAARARRENEKIPLLSFSIPEITRYRQEDRPPSPPRFAFRDRITTEPSEWMPQSNRENREQQLEGVLNTDNAVDRVFAFLNGQGFNPLMTLWYNIYNLTGRRRGAPESLLFFTMRNKLNNRAKRARSNYILNDTRYYWLRFEKARAMDKYNKEMLQAVGDSDDPIKYQRRIHNVLRKFVSTVFRIDYSMRIYHLIRRMLRMSSRTYWNVLGFALALTFVSRFLFEADHFTLVAFITTCWAAVPIALGLLWLIWWIVYVVISLLRLPTGRHLVEEGAKDVERSQYALALKHLVYEQYKVIEAAVEYEYKHSRVVGKVSVRNRLLHTVNAYNRKIDDFSNKLSISVRKIEPTSLINKLEQGKARWDARGFARWTPMDASIQPQNPHNQEPPISLTEIQNFALTRELVQISGEHDVGRRLEPAEFAAIRERLNRYISVVFNDKYMSGNAALENVVRRLSEFRDRVSRFDISGGTVNGDMLVNDVDYLSASINNLDFMPVRMREAYAEAIRLRLEYRSLLKAGRDAKTVRLCNMLEGCGLGGITEGLTNGNEAGQEAVAVLNKIIRNLENTVSQFFETTSGEVIDRFKENIERVLSERANDSSSLSIEERFRLKSEIVGFVESFNVDQTIDRTSVAKDFIKLIDDVGGTQERVIIVRVAQDNMI